MKVATLPPQKFLKEALRYDAATGKLYWRKRPLHHFSTEGQQRRWNRRYPGKEAFATADPVWGYLRGRIGKQSFLAHRVVWKMVRDTEPPPIVDHRDRNPKNNRDKNLREATNTQNCLNGKRSGVSFDSGHQKWRARVTVGGKRVCLGRYGTEREALEARRARAVVEYGEFAP